MRKRKRNRWNLKKACTLLALVLCMAGSGCGAEKTGNENQSVTENSQESAQMDQESVDTDSMEVTEQEEAEGLDTEETAGTRKENAKGQSKEALGETDTENNHTEESDSEKNDSEENPVEIYCWGDSLTYGEGGDDVTYPGTLQELSGCSVYNYGIQGEIAKQIGIRMGVYPLVTSAFTIPADATPVSLGLLCDGVDPTMFRLGDAGLNPCTINGVEGRLSYQESDGQYYFVRAEKGTEVAVADQTRVETYASMHKPDENDIVILFAGTNDRPVAEETQRLIEQDKEMLSYLGCRNYLVVGLTCKDMVPEVEAVNWGLEQEFGSNYIDVRKYFLEKGLKDAGVAATEQDNADIANGEIPSSLRVDVVHGTSVFYRLLGEQIYAKLVEQGYL